MRRLCRNARGVVGHMDEALRRQGQWRAARGAEVGRVRSVGMAGALIDSASVALDKRLVVSDARSYDARYGQSSRASVGCERVRS